MKGAKSFTLWAMKKAFQLLIVSTIAMAGALSFTGCNDGSEEGPETPEANANEEAESIAEESESGE